MTPDFKTGIGGILGLISGISIGTINEILQVAVLGLTLYFMLRRLRKPEQAPPRDGGNAEL